MMDAKAKNWVPWLDGIYIHDCFVIKDLQIDIAQNGEQVGTPRHLILTGRNGSGKSSVLRAIDDSMGHIREVGSKVPENTLITKRTALADEDRSAFRTGLRSDGSYVKLLYGSVSLAKPLGRHFEGDLKEHLGSYSYTMLSSERLVTKFVDTNTLEHSSQVLEDLFGRIEPDFERILVSMKVSALFHRENGNELQAKRYENTLARILNCFKRIFEDDKLELRFLPHQLRFYFLFKDRRTIGVREAADGPFSLVLIILTILSHQEKIRGEDSNDDSDIPGIVLIDEPELHLHLDLQYQIMPLLTDLFPKVQFIVATHSPAVISSIRNATVYDLTRREYAPTYVAGESFSSLMETHFGLDNEFGPVADELIHQVRHIYLNGGTKKEKATAIRSVMENYRDIITPTLRVELESTIIHLDTQSEAR